MIAFDLGENFAGAGRGESVLFLVRADEEYIAGEVIGKGLIMHGANAYFEITHNDIALAQRYVSGDHHGVGTGRVGRVSCA